MKRTGSSWLALLWLIACSATDGSGAASPRDDEPSEMDPPESPPTATTTSPPPGPAPTTTATAQPTAMPTTTATTEPDPPPAMTSELPEYDPNVHFEWAQTEPGPGACQAGTYSGSFACDMTFLPGFPPTVFTGPLTFTLIPSQDGEFLEINARFDASTMGVPFGADLVGELDCGTLELNATLNDGVYGTAPPIMGPFFGSLEGTLDPLSSTLSGTWSLTAGTPALPTTAPCIGSWSAVRQPSDGGVN